MYSAAILLQYFLDRPSQASKTLDRTARRDPLSIQDRAIQSTYFWSWFLDMEQSRITVCKHYVQSQAMDIFDIFIVSRHPHARQFTRDKPTDVSISVHRAVGLICKSDPKNARMLPPITSFNTKETSVFTLSQLQRRPETSKSRPDDHRQASKEPNSNGRETEQGIKFSHGISIWISS